MKYGAIKDGYIRYRLMNKSEMVPDEEQFAQTQADIAYIAAKQGYYISQAGLLAAELE